MRLRLALAAALAIAGCADPPPTQHITGRISLDDFPAPALGVRAVQDGVVVAQATVGEDGRFQLDVPEGSGTRLEVVTRKGIHQFIIGHGGQARVLAFESCCGDFDLGDVDFWEQGDELPDNDCDTDPPVCDDMNDPRCTCDPDTGIGCEDPPQPCDPATDPDCSPCQDPMDPNCQDPCLQDPSLCDPCQGDPNCDPCLVDPAFCDPCLLYPEWCWPDPCLDHPDSMDNCGCWPDDPMCPDDDPNCWPDPVEPPPCDDNTDPDNQSCWEEPPQGALPEDVPAEECNQ